MYNVPSVDNRNQESWTLLVKEQIANIAKLRTFFWSVSMIFCVFQHGLVFVSLRTSLLSIVGEIPEGGSMAAVVDISDR